MKNIYNLQVVLLLVTICIISGCDILDTFKSIIGPIKVESSFSVEVEGEIYSSDMDEYPHVGSHPYTLRMYNNPAFIFDGRKILFNSKGQGINFFFYLKEYSKFETNKKYYFHNITDEDNRYQTSHVLLYMPKDYYTPIYATSGWVEFTEISDKSYANGKFELKAIDSESDSLSLKNGQFSHIHLDMSNISKPLDNK